MRIIILFTLLSLSLYSWAQTNATLGGHQLLSNPSSLCTLEITDTKNAHNLNNSPSYTIGEYLHLMVMGNCSLHIYLYSIDSTGVVNALPNLRGDLVGQGQLIANQPLMIPSSAEDYSYQLSGTTGHESIFAIGTVNPLDDQGIAQFASIIQAALEYYNNNPNIGTLSVNVNTPPSVQASDWTTGIMRYILGETPFAIPNYAGVNTHPNTNTVTPQPATTPTGLTSTTQHHTAASSTVETTSSKYVDDIAIPLNHDPMPMGGNMTPLDETTKISHPNKAILTLKTAPGSIVLLRHPATNQNSRLVELEGRPGEFAVALVNGAYIVHVSNEAYIPQTGSFTVQAGYMTALNMILQPKHSSTPSTISSSTPVTTTPTTPIVNTATTAAPVATQQYATVNIIAVTGSIVEITGYGIVPESSTTPGHFPVTLPPNSYTANIRRDGFIAQTVSFTALPNQQNIVNVISQSNW